MYKSANEGVGPGAYLLKEGKQSPSFSMSGGRYDMSPTENKNKRLPKHLQSQKKDVPGPGAYNHPTTINKSPEMKRPTFGGATRKWSDLPQDCPAPNAYSPVR